MQGLAATRISDQSSHFGSCRCRSCFDPCKMHHLHRAGFGTRLFQTERKEILEQKEREGDG